MSPTAAPCGGACRALLPALDGHGAQVRRVLERRRGHQIVARLVRVVQVQHHARS